MSDDKNIFSDIEQYLNKLDTTEWEGTLKEYIPMVRENAKLAQLSHARVLDMIESAGIEFDEKDKNKQNPKYTFFKKDLFGVDDAIHRVVKYLKAAASGSQVGRRILLLYGPTSSGKSQLAALLKNGLEEYSRTPAGAIYALKDCPINENPLNAIPHALRETFRKDGIKIDPLAKLCPLCQLNLEEKYANKFLDMPVKRIFLSESSRVGIGTFLPSDPKCVAGDTLISASNGIYPIKQIVNNKNEGPIDINVYTKDHSIKKANRSFRYENQEVIKIKTRLGFDISATQNHPLMTVNSNGDFIWKNVGDMKIGDTVVMSTGSGINFERKELPENPLNIKYLTNNLALFMGLYISEGCMDKKDRYVEITNMSPDIQKIVRNAMEEIGETDRYHLYKKNKEDDYYVRNMICSKKLVQTMRIFGFKDGAHNKSIPDCIMSSGKVDKVLLGMWLGDGNCGKHATKNTSESSYSTVSPILANQVHLLMLSLGIPAMKYFEDYTGTAGAYKIVTMGKRTEDIFDKLEIPSWKLTRPLANNVKHGDNIILMPPVHNLIDDILNKNKDKTMNDKWYRYSYNSEHKCYRKFTKNSLNDFIKCFDKIADKESMRKLRAINDEKFVYTTITEISKSIDTVYDIEVPGEHNFIANGFVSHNSQSITELVGSVDFSKLGDYGVESDPRAYKFDGELNVANRGIIELIEMLKVDVKFLYVLLTLAQEKCIKTERFPLIYADEFVVAHSNETEYRRFLADKKLEALHDRIIVCKCPYNLTLNEEVKIYEKLLAEADFGNIHIAPLTIKVASMFAVLSRLEVAKDQNLSLLKKMQLYNGEDVEGFTSEDVKNIKEETEQEGMIGISPRYIFNSIADCFTKYDMRCITPVDVLRSIKENFPTNAKLTKEDITRFDDLLTIVVEEYTKMAKTEVQKAFFLNFEGEIINLLNNYIDQVGAYLDNTDLADEFGDTHSPDEHLMRSIEEKVGVSSSAKDSFRAEVYRKVIKSKNEKGEFDYRSHAKLREALEKQLFEERQDTIRLTISTRNPDPIELQKLNCVIDTLVKNYGYTSESANALLRYVSSLMSRTT